MKKYLLFWVVILFSSQVFAQSDYNKTVSAVGVQGGNYYFRVAGGFSVSCLYDVIYFSNESGFGKGAYSTLLSAKSQNKPLTRIEYSIDATSNVCTLGLVEF